MRRSRIARIGNELFEERRKQKEMLKRALKGLSISDTEIDRMIAKRIDEVGLIDRKKRKL